MLINFAKDKMKKLRDQDRLHRSIQKSIISDSALNLDQLVCEGYNSFELEDWYGHKLSTSRKYRKVIIQYLFDICFRWKCDLITLNQPFYLAIWLCEPRLSKSEVVCAIGEKIDYYKNEALMQPTESLMLSVDQYGTLAKYFKQFNWSPKLDLEPYYDFEINWPKEQYASIKDYKFTKRFFTKLLNKKLHVIDKGDQKIYFHPEGITWVGQEVGEESILY